MLTVREVMQRKAEIHLFYLKFTTSVLIGSNPVKTNWQSDVAILWHKFVTLRKKKSEIQNFWQIALISHDFSYHMFANIGKYFILI